MAYALPPFRMPLGDQRTGHPRPHTAQEAIVADRDRMSSQSSSSHASSRDQQSDQQSDQRDQGDGMLSTGDQGLSSAGRDVGSVSGSRSAGGSRDEGMQTSSSSSDEVLPQHDALRSQSRDSASNRSSRSRSSRRPDDSGTR